MYNAAKILVICLILAPAGAYAEEELSDSEKIEQIIWEAWTRDLPKTLSFIDQSSPCEDGSV